MELQRIVLAPYDPDRTEVDLAKGTTVIVADCGHEAFVAPESKAMLDNPLINTDSMCTNCTGRDADSLVSIAQFGLFVTPDVFEEAVNDIGDEEKVRARMRQLNIITTGNATNPNANP